MLRDFIGRFGSVAIASVVAATVGVAALTACGVKGPLKLPSPPPATTTGATSQDAPSTPASESGGASTPKPSETRP